MKKTKSLFIAITTLLFIFLTGGLSVYKIYELNFLNSLRLAIESKERKTATDNEKIINNILNSINNKSSNDIKKIADTLLVPSKNQDKNIIIALKDGTLLGHSKLGEMERLSGNIATDEFVYNIDLIFQPVSINLDSTFQSDYYIIDYKPPFNKKETERLKHYIISDIDKNGTLFSRRFVSSDNGEGVIAIIYSKKSLYSFINNQLTRLTNIKYIIFAMSLIIASLIAVLLYTVLRCKQTNSSNIICESALQPDLSPAPDMNKSNFRRDVRPLQSGVEPVILDAIPIKKRGN
ncbi:MAG: hypothetical protein JXK07_06020 [Spirochaetes bacterium]|nr:hypothetical protein [Spirochaetota bacterium]MBN2771434.1 hypothetical protein [Spirochaetota bacterium]